MSRSGFMLVGNFGDSAQCCEQWVMAIGAIVNVKRFVKPH